MIKDRSVETSAPAIVNQPAVTVGTFDSFRTKFIDSAVLILVVTSAAKLASIFGTARVLSAPDPLFGILNRQFFLGAGLVELVVAGVLFWGKNQTVKLILLAWLSANFILYHIASWLFGSGKPCPCLGSVVDLFSMSQGMLDALLALIVGYLFLGSVAFLALGKWGRKRNAG